MAWNQVRGHDELIAGFRRAAARGRLAHAYLFSGPEGVGKSTFARELAAALLCETTAAAELAACGRCAACLQVGASTHPDFYIFARPEQAPEFPVGLMRQVCQSFALKSARGRGKVVLVEDADDLNEEAANCFLKTLEEPPPRSVLILIGTTTDRQLPTIVSRCQIVRFSPLPRPLLEELLQAQGIEDPRVRAQQSWISGGSVGRALRLADPSVWEFRRQFLDELANRAMRSILLAQKIVSFAEEAGKEAPAQRRRARIGLGLIIDFLNDALAVSQGGEAQRTPPEEQTRLRAFLERTDPDRLQALMERCLEADWQIERNVQLVLVLEALVDAICQAARL